MPMSPRLLRPTSSGLNLRQIAGLLDWWDASVASSLVLNGGFVEQWNPLAGSRPLTQSASNDRPGIGAINGRTSVLFDGSNDHLNNTTLGSQTKTIVAVIAANSSGTQGILGEGDSSNTANRKFIHSSGGFLSFSRQTAAVGNSPTKSTAQPQIAVASYETAEALRVDGATSGGTPSALISTATGFVIGARFFSGVASTFYNGHVCEVATFSRVLSAAEITRVERYLAAKWGVTLYSPPAYADADVNAYITAVELADGGLMLESGVRDAINDFITGCKSDGIWDAIKASCILAGARTLAGALTPLVGTAPTNNGPFVSGDYNRETGLVGNGTSKYLDSNRNNNADPQDSKHISFYVSSVATGSVDRYMGSGGAVAGSTVVFRGSTSSNWRTNGAGTSTVIAVANAGMAGFCGMSRSVSANFAYRAAGSTATGTLASVTPQNANIHVFAGDNGNHADCRLAFYSIGESLDLALLDTRVSALITAIGNAI